MSLKVLIAGGGIGGLCLAQGLRKAGIDVALFERDVSISVRGQGYRFRVDAEGDSALQECLPSHLYELYRATANQPSSPPIGAFDHQLNLVYRLNTGGSGPARSTGHLAVNRLTLRQVLFGELEDIVHFDHALTGFEQGENGVQARFANGQTIEGNILIAADGSNSIIRRQLLPQAEILDTGMRCIYGKTLLDAEIIGWLPEALFGGFVPVLGPNRCTLALGMYRSCRPFEEAVAELAPTVHLDPVPDYLMWMFVAPQEAYTSADDPLEHSDNPTFLHRLVLKRTQEWHPDLHRLLEMADVGATFPISIRTSRPIPPWTPSNITFLGDAIHLMTPAGGIGANTAMRDAALLTQQLVRVSRGEIGLVAAVAIYEASMREYGFAAVERSLTGATQLYRITLPGQEVRA